MGFLNSLGLWGGLAAAGVAVPIIIHLLYRKHRRQTPWAAMELLRRALVVRSGQVKIEDLLILVLRCLAIFLIAAALVRPTLNSDSAAWLGEKRVGLVVAIDASYSMGHGEHSRYERALSKAREILNTAREGDPVSLVAMSNRPEILVRRRSYTAGIFEGALEANSEPRPYRLGLEQNLEELEKLVAELKTPARECYLITDAQESDWSELSDQAVETLARIVRMASVFVVPVDNDGEENLSVRSLSYASGSLSRAGTARFIVEVRNCGRRTAEGGTLEFLVDGGLITRRAVGALKGGETRGISFFTSFPKSGDVLLEARLSRDDLAVDNRRFGVVKVSPTVRVLCVDGHLASGQEASRKGAYYALRALRLRGDETDHPVEVSHIEPPDLSLEKFGEHDVILLVDVPDLAPEVVKRLDNFVRRGGGLIFFLGAQVKPDLYNERFGAGDAGLLPGKLIDRVAAAIKGEADKGSQNLSWSIQVQKSSDSLAAIVRRLPGGLVDSARVSQVIRVEPHSSSQKLLAVGEEGLPLLLSRQIGTGTSLLFTTSADRSWNELPVHPIYTMLLQQAVTSLTSHPERRQFIVGESADIPVPSRQVGDLLQISTPRGGTLEVKVSRSGSLSVCALDPDQAGIYRLAGKTDDSAAESVIVAFNVDPEESRVRILEIAALRKQLNPVGVEVIADSTTLAGAIEAGRQGREIADLLLALGLLAFFLQAVLAKRFTDRMSDDKSDLSSALQMSRVVAARRS